MDHHGDSALAHRVLTLEPGKVDSHYWHDIWTYRELFLVLAWRDLSIRYKQSVIGVGWALIRPLLTMIIFTFVFGNVAGLPSSGDTPYPVMVLTGTLFWFLFATALGDASQSLVNAANMIKKVYYPRIMSPLAALSVALADFLVSLALLFIMMIYYQVMPDWRIIAFPAFLLFGLATALGPGLLFAAMNVQYRDFRFIVPFIVQFGLYVSPVGYTSEVVPEKWQLLYYLNPMASVIDGVRWSLLGGQTPINLTGLLMGVGVTVIVLFIGLALFRRTEKTFADLV